MKGEYNMKISGRQDGGFKIRIANSKTKKVSQFIATNKAIENGKYFLYLLNDAITRTK